MLKLIKTLIRNFRYPEGIYKTVNGLVNRKGESLDQLFDRRDQYIRDQIKASYPKMSYREYMSITTDKACNIYRIKGEPKDNVGAVLQRKSETASNLILYNIT